MTSSHPDWNGFRGTLDDIAQAIGFERMVEMFCPTREQFHRNVLLKLRSAILDIERSAKQVRKMGEDGYSDFIATHMRGAGFICIRERHSRGHVDLHIELTGKPGFVLIVESKIWDGASYHWKACSQILEQYQTGRESVCSILQFFPEAGRADRMRELRISIADDMAGWFNCTSVEDDPDEFQHAFCTRHEHEGGERTRVHHYSADLYIRPQRQKPESLKKEVALKTPKPAKKPA